MAEYVNTGQFAHLQDVMATLPMTRSFIPFCLAFSTPVAVRDDSIINALRIGLDKLADAFPYLAGQVLLQDYIPKIANPNNTNSGIELTVRDLRQDAPSLFELKKAKFPFSLLDGKLLVPPIVTSWIPEQQVAPVITFQASFVQDGLILGIFGNHTQVCAVLPWHPNSIVNPDIW